MNNVILVGRAGQDPDIKYFESGKVKTSFSLAVNRWDSKVKGEVTDWFNVEMWDKLAEIAGEYVKKGKLVTVDGRLMSRKWQDPSGETKERFLINANNMRLLGGKTE